jgi:hypothetical protein
VYDNGKQFFKDSALDNQVKQQAKYPTFKKNLDGGILFFLTPFLVELFVQKIDEVAFKWKCT